MQQQSMQQAPDPQAQSRRLHKKLVPANIVILLLALTAVVSLLAGSMLSVSVRINGDFVSQVMEQAMAGSSGGQSPSQGEGETGGSDGSADSGSGQTESTDQNEQMVEMMQYVFSDVDYTLHVRVNPVEMFLAGVAADNQAVRDYLTELLSEARTSLEGLIKQIMPAFLSVVVATAVENVDVDQLENVSTEEIGQVVTLLSENQTEEAKAQFPALAQKFVSEQLGKELTSDQLTQASDIFNTIVDNGTKDGEFSFYSVITMMSGGSGEGGEGSSQNPLDTIFSAADNLDDNTVSTVKLVFVAVTAAGVGLAAFCWFMLALLSFIHIFAKNKKVAMWYVKLFGFLPCMLFFVAPTLALAIVPGMVGGSNPAMAMISSLGASFVGTVLLSGACYILLWLVSIFWCFPIKRKIRKLKKTGAI